MSDKIMVEQQDLEVIKSLQQAGTQLAKRYGEIAVQLLVAEMARDEVKAAIGTLETERRKITTEIEKKYGAGTINLDTGEFTPTA